LDVQKTSEETNRKKQLWEKRRMVNFMKAIETLKRWIGVEKRSGEDRRVKRPRKRKYEKRKAGIKSDRRK
tara:strand:- start:764 stop:973 length:210 start_codon:yes stop_codon:yes gene_type:complete